MKKFTRLVAAAIFIGSPVVAIAQSSGADRILKCREWIDSNYQGYWQFAYEQRNQRIAIDFASDKEQKRPSKSETATVVWSSDDSRSVVAYVVDKSSWHSPVTIYSVDFGRVRMFLYSNVGSVIEGDLLVSKIVHECERLD